MLLCERDLSKGCEGKYKDCTDCVLDKIRAEIVDLGQRTTNDNRASGIWACRDIIDKYKAESEETDADSN